MSHQCQLSGTYVSHTDVSFPIPFSPMVEVLTSIYTAFSVDIHDYFVTLLSPRCVRSAILKASTLFLFFRRLQRTSDGISVGQMLSRNLAVGSITPSLVPHATGSVSTCTIGDAANERKYVFFVSYGRCEPSFPMFDPLLGFVSDDAAYTFSSHGTTNDIVNRNDIAVYSG